MRDEDCGEEKKANADEYGDEREEVGSSDEDSDGRNQTGDLGFYQGFAKVKDNREYVPVKI